MTNKGIAALALGCALFYVPGTCAKVLPLSGGKAPLKIVADYAQMDNANHKGIFRGHVRLDQGGSHLTANTLTVYTNGKNQLVKAVAKGNLAHYWSKKDPSKPTFHARAKTIRYLAEKQLVILEGSAKAQQGPNSFSGPKIAYDQATQVVTSFQNKAARTEIVLLPKTLSKPGSSSQTS